MDTFNIVQEVLNRIHEFVHIDELKQFITDLVKMSVDTEAEFDYTFEEVILELEAYPEYLELKYGS